ncbi:hypothetical protein OLQ22_08340 [Campylobacter jejuni]|nr:hypothetical protein [Campylobacter jejuni]
MQSLNEILLQKKIKEIRFKAIASIVCGFLSIIPYLGVLFALASWILFFIVLYDLKIYGGTKNLFKNLFIVAGIGFFGILINVSVLFVILKPRIDIFGGLYFNEDNAFLAIGTFCVLFYITLALIFPFFKAFYYEIARVTKQKYFINAFWAYFIGICTLPLFGLGAIGVLIGYILKLVAWIKFKEFDEQEIVNLEERLAKEQKKVFDLKWIKITMASFIILNLLVLVFIIFQYFISFVGLDYNAELYIRRTLFYIATILALLSVFLFCKKLKTYKLFIYFLIWQGLSVFCDYILFTPPSIIMSKTAHGSLIIVLNLCCIILAFLFFKSLVQITKEKLFYLVFIFFTCNGFVAICYTSLLITLNHLVFEKLFLVGIILFQVAYFISFLIFWLKLKGQKSVKIC